MQLCPFFPMVDRWLQTMMVTVMGAKRVGLRHSARLNRPQAARVRVSSMMRTRFYRSFINAYKTLFLSLSCVRRDTYVLWGRVVAFGTSPGPNVVFLRGDGSGCYNERLGK